MLIRKKLYGGLMLTGLALSSVTLADTLEQAVEKSVYTSPALQQSYFRVQQLGENVNVARADYYPSVFLTGSVGEEQTDYLSGLNVDRRLETTQLGLVIRQSLFSGLRTVNDVSRLSAEEQAERFLLYSEAEDTAMQTIEIYLELLLATKTLEIAQQNEQEHQRIRDAVESKVSNQLAPSSDLAQVEGRLASARSSVVAAYSQIHELKSRYFATVGEAPGDLIDPSSGQLVLPYSLPAALEVAINEHPQILSSKQSIEAASREYRASKGLHAPEVYLELSANRNDNNGGVEGLDENAAVMLRVEYELFAGGGHSARVRSSSHNVSAAMNARRDTEVQVRQGVEISWHSADYTSQQLDYLSENVRKAEEAERGYQSQYDVGRRDLLSLLIVKSETFAAKRSYLNVYYQNMIAQYRVQHAMGVLLNNLTIEYPDDWKVEEE